MKAILIKGGDELRKIFKQLTEELYNIQPKNLKQEKKTYVFKRELFYDINKSDKFPYHVDVTLKFNEEKYGEYPITLTLPNDFFVQYKDLNRYNLTLFDKKDLLKIREYSINEEDYEMCSEIKNVLDKLD